MRIGVVLGSALAITCSGMLAQAAVNSVTVEYHFSGVARDCYTCSDYLAQIDGLFSFNIDPANPTLGFASTPYATGTAQTSLSRFGWSTSVNAPYPVFQSFGSLDAIDYATAAPGLLASRTGVYGEYDTYYSRYAIRQQFATTGTVAVYGSSAVLSAPSGSFVITQVPEPAGWVSLLVGFGLAGMMLRRERRVLAPA